MISVCIDTSVLASVAIVESGRNLAQVSDPNPRRQAEGLGDLFAASLSRAGLYGPVKEMGIHQIIVGTGPGPYTGLRAGLAFAAALGAGLGVEVLGVSSQEILGLAATKRTGEGNSESATALVMTDARRREVYYSVWERAKGAPKLLAGPAVGDLQTALDQANDADVTFAGPVPEHLVGGLTEAGAQLVDLDVSLLAEIVSLRKADSSDTQFSLEPQYLRRPDVNVK